MAAQSTNVVQNDAYRCVIGTNSTAVDQSVREWEHLGARPKERSAQRERKSPLREQEEPSLLVLVPQDVAEPHPGVLVRHSRNLRASLSQDQDSDLSRMEFSLDVRDSQELRDQLEKLQLKRKQNPCKCLCINICIQCTQHQMHI